MSDDQKSANTTIMLEAAKAALEDEAALAERLDNKARGQATLAGSWFAVTQAVAASAIGSHADKGFIIGCVIGLGAQALALVLLLRADTKVWRLRTEQGTGTASIREMQNKIDSTGFTSDVTDFYCAMLDSARNANGKRADAFDAENKKGSRWAHFSSASFWWWPVLWVGLLEIAAALVSTVVH